MVALVVAGAAEDRARAVFHQHEVGGVDRQRFARHQRMLGEQRQLVALLLGGLDLGRCGAGLVAFLDEALQAGIARGQVGDDRMVDREGRERGAVQRVGPRREDLELAFVGARRIRELPEHARAAALADPVGLHHADLLGPAIERAQTLQQLVGEVRDLEVPLRQLAALDGGAGAPALALDHLLVGQHGVVDRIPVHPGLAAVGEPRLPEVKEHLLLVAIVGGIARGELATPVE